MTRIKNHHFPSRKVNNQQGLHDLGTTGPKWITIIRNFLPAPFYCYNDEGKQLTEFWQYASVLKYTVTCNLFPCRQQTG